MDSGRATQKIDYPSRMLTLQSQAGSSSQRLQLLRPDAYPEGCEPYVYLKPMTHTCNAHHLVGDFGLRRLRRGESLDLSHVIQPVSMSSQKHEGRTV